MKMTLDRIAAVFNIPPVAVEQAAIKTFGAENVKYGLAQYELAEIAPALIEIAESAIDRNRAHMKKWQDVRLKLKIYASPNC